MFDYKGPRENTSYDGLKIEVQVRTRLQHAWATAVEAVGIFTKQALKSNQGDEDWLRFFALMGSAIAAIEKCNPIPNTPLDKQNLINEIKILSDSLHVGEMLMVYNTTIQAVGAAKDAKYFLLILDPDAAKITVRRYKAKESEKANRDYTKLESEIVENSATQVVLVSVENINALKRAYPNYFLDTNTFSDVVKQVLNGKFPDPIK
ncbi:hypothetical protein LRX75_14560 [Rhizobium sp. DKSPLA3]|uniref:RelA/SpoT domain-containing protein n=1 Tax=Rhizobium quercicola TaxID=2901226 RepID=A0A9X1T1M8_9HYPH|nr:hypothetical protein [Rhizobium quercicola]